MSTSTKEFPIARVKKNDLDCTNLFPSRATKNLEYYLSSHIVTYQAYKTMLDGKELSPSS